MVRNHGFYTDRNDVFGVLFFCFVFLPVFVINFIGTCSNVPS